MNAIVFLVNVDDIVAFNLHHLKHSRQGRRSIVTGILICIVLALALRGYANATVGHTIGIVALAINILVLSAMYVALLLWMTARQVRRNYSDDKPNASTGRHELTLKDDELVEISETGSRSARYDSIRNIDETEQHVFVYLGPLEAHIIPKSTDIRGLDGFMDELRSRVAAAD